MPVVYQRLTDRILATGVTPSDLIHIVITGDTSQDPDGSSYKATIQQLFDSLTGYCITDLYTSNIHSCSPLNINPLDEGDVYFGSESGVTLNLNGSFSRVGINNDSPSATLDIIGKFSSNRLFLQTQGLGSVANTSNFSLYNPTNSSGNYFGFNRYAGTISSPSDFPDGESPLISKFVGYVYKDSALNASTQITMAAKDLATSVYNGYISFATTSGNTLNERMIIDYNGNVGINIDSPSEKLEVSGKTKTTNFQMTSGATNNYILTSDSLGNAYWGPPPNRGLFSQTGNSVTISATTTETTLIDGGVGTLSIPANVFSVGDSFRAHMGGIINAGNNEDIRIRIKAGSTILSDSGMQNLVGSTNDIWILELNFVIRAIGGAGIAEIVTLGNFTTYKSANNTATGFAFNTTNNTTFDTTTTNTLDITAQWDTTSASNSIYSDIFTLRKIY